MPSKSKVPDQVARVYSWFHSDEELQFNHDVPTLPDAYLDNYDKDDGVVMSKELAERYRIGMKLDKLSNGESSQWRENYIQRQQKPAAPDDLKETQKEFLIVVLLYSLSVFFILVGLLIAALK